MFACNASRVAGFLSEIVDPMASHRGCGDTLIPYECLSVVSATVDAAVSNLDELRSPVTGVKLCGIDPYVYADSGGDCLV